MSTRLSSHCALHVIREGTKDFFFISHKTCVIDIGIEEAGYVREVLPVKTGHILSMPYVPILFNCLRSVRFGSVHFSSGAAYIPPGNDAHIHAIAAPPPAGAFITESATDVGT